MQEGWLGAETWDATRQLDAACDAYAAWQPAAEQLLAAAAGEEDMLPETPRSRCAMLCCVVPCCAVLCCAVPCFCLRSEAVRWGACAVDGRIGGMLGCMPLSLTALLLAM